MIEVNLIPDVKQEFIRAQRMRNTVISFSILTSIVAGAAIVVLIAYLGTQGVRETFADNGIKDEYRKLSEIENLNNVVTIQNQLAQVSAINDSKGINSRIFDVLTAINPVPPNDVRLTTIELDPKTTTLSIEGVAANSYTATDVLKKTILNTKVSYSDGSGTQTMPLTELLTLGDTSYGEDSTGAKVLRFKMTIVYPKQLFSNTVNDVRIISPTGSIDVTDSRTRVPDSLFTEPATDLKKAEDN